MFVCEDGRYISVRGRGEVNLVSLGSVRERGDVRLVSLGSRAVFAFDDALSSVRAGGEVGFTLLGLTDLGRTLLNEALINR